MVMLAAVWQVLVQLAPWLLLGTVIAAVLHVLLPRDLIRRQFRGYAGVAKAVLLGVPMPLCSCGVIPAGLGLKKDGASDGAAVGFLVSTPQTGVDSILVSASFLGWPFALFKVASAALTGLVAGFWVEASSRGAAAEPAAVAEAPGGPRALPLEMWSHGIDILRSIWRWLVFGVVVSAAIEVLVPDQALAALGRFGSLGAGVAALAVSLPLYVCATASVPIAAALVGAGMPAGAALVFLMAGPASNVATIGAVYRALGKKALAIYLATIVAGSLGLGVLFDGVIGSAAARAAVAHEHGAAWWGVASAAALLALTAWFAVEDLRRLVKRYLPEVTMPDSREITIEGMMCENCVRHVETALRETEGVTAVEVTLEPARAVVSGAVEEWRLREAIAGAGYTPV
ncbi:MAG: permease [Acidobacteriota bacterium]|nr:permease [Acidobacteriota bacterium]MDH3523013.1 permease [Acidobacteriota bacterium]